MFRRVDDGRQQALDAGTAWSLALKWSRFTIGLEGEHAEFVAGAIDREVRFMKGANVGTSQIGKFILPTVQAVAKHVWKIRGLLLLDRDPTARVREYLDGTFVEAVTTTTPIVDVVGSLGRPWMWAAWHAYAPGLTSRLITAIQDEVRREKAARKAVK